MSILKKRHSILFFCVFSLLQANDAGVQKGLERQIARRGAVRSLALILLFPIAAVEAVSELVAMDSDDDFELLEAGPQLTGTKWIANKTSDVVEFTFATLNKLCCRGDYKTTSELKNVLQDL